MGVRIIAYDGVKVIGGNKILIEDEERDSRVFLDFGQSFTQRAKFFEEYLKPRPAVGLRDLLSLELLPPLEGIYRTDFTKALNEIDYSYLRNHPRYRDLRGVKIDGVYLSHAHLDHSGYISFLREDIPIYCTAMTAAVAKSVQDVGQPSDFEREITYFSWRESNKEGLLGGDREKNYYGRPFVVVDNPQFVEGEFWRKSSAKRRKIEVHPHQGLVDRIGNLPLHVLPVDHSIFGATACALQTSAGWVIYTGDLRFHGVRGPALEKVATWMRALEPVALLCEGTRIDVQNGGQRLTEKDVQDTAFRLAKAHHGLIIADFAARNVDRLLAFSKIAKQLGRQLAISPADAYLLQAMRSADKSLPDITADETVVIYADVKSKPRGWEQIIRAQHRARLLHAAQVRRDPSAYLLAFSFFDINDLVDIGISQNLKDAIYLYSSSEAFNEEVEIDIGRLSHWLSRFGLEFIGNPLDPQRQPGLHVSGHAPGYDLLQLVQLVRPQMVIPIHTLEPERFLVLQEEGIHVEMPEVGKPILL